MAVISYDILQNTAEVLRKLCLVNGKTYRRQACNHLRFQYFEWKIHSTLGNKYSGSTLDDFLDNYCEAVYQTAVGGPGSNENAFWVYQKSRSQIYPGYQYSRFGLIEWHGEISRNYKNIITRIGNVLCLQRVIFCMLQRVFLWKSDLLT
jgi:hypothetical protein